MAVATHPLASLIPEMSDDEYRELRDDIAEHGLRQPIVLYEHMVLDGRHRARACEETGTVPRYEEYVGVEPAAHVLSLNLHRRHLSVSQRAMIATDFLPHLENEARQRQGVRHDLHPTSAPFGAEVDSGRASHQAATSVGVSPRVIERAKRVVEEAPDLAPAVRAGEMTVNAAHDTVLERKRRDPKPETGSVSARSVERIAQMAAALAPAVEHLNLSKSCARLTGEEREAALRSCKSGLKALNALANALGR